MRIVQRLCLAVLVLMMVGRLNAAESGSKSVRFLKAVGTAVSDRFVFLEQADAGVFFNLNGGGNYGITKSPVFNVDERGMVTLDFGHLKNIDNSDGSMCGAATVRWDRVLTRYFPQVTDKIYRFAPDAFHGFMRHLWISGTVSYVDKTAEDEKILYGPSVGLFWQF